MATIGFASEGARARFQSSGSHDILHEAIIEVLGADLRINATTGTKGAGPAEPVRPPEPASAPARAAASASEAGTPNAPDHSEWSRQARESVRPTSSEVRHDETPPSEGSDESRDDVSLDESGADAAELIRRELGGEVIDDHEY